MMTGQVTQDARGFHDAGLASGRHAAQQVAPVHTICRMLHQMQFCSFPWRCRMYAAACAGARPAPQLCRGGSGRWRAARPPSAAGPGSGPFATTNSARLAVSGRSASRYAWISAATSGSSGTRRSLPPLPITLTQPRGMSTSPTARPEHLSRPQAGKQHQPGDRPVPVGAETAQQRGGLGPVQPTGQPARLTDPQPRAAFAAGPNAPAAHCAHRRRPGEPRPSAGLGPARPGPASPSSQTSPRPRPAAG